MKLLAVVLVHNRFDLARDVLEQLEKVTDRLDTGTLLFVFDNASAHRIRDEKWAAWFPVRRFEPNFGNYPVFPHALQCARDYGADLVAVFHSDLYVWEHGWDRRLLTAFETDPQLGLVGFIGAPGIGANGGRNGTVSNFQGRRGGGEWSRHGSHTTGLVPAAVVDGCAMVCRVEALQQIGHREAFPPHHFYDRLISCQMLEAGWRVGVMGIACDHLGGQTAVLEPGWHQLAERWCKARGLIEIEGFPGNWELPLYREAERQWLEEYRDRKALVPCDVDGAWGLQTEWKRQVPA